MFSAAFCAADSVVPVKATIPMAERIPIKATTTNNSINVNAFLFSMTLSVVKNYPLSSTTVAVRGVSSVPSDFKILVVKVIVEEDTVISVCPVTPPDDTKAP